MSDPNVKKPENSSLRTGTGGVSAKDVIYRQAAIDVIQKYKCEHGYAYADCACDIEKDLKALSSADAIELGVEYDTSCFRVTVETKTEVYRNDSDTLYVPRRVFKVERL